MAFNTTLDASFRLRAAWKFLNTLDISTSDDKGVLNYTKGLTSGNGENQVQELWHDRRFVAPSSTTDDIDLAGALTNAFGRTVTFATVRALAIHNLGIQGAGETFTETAGEDIQVGGAGAAGNAWGALFNSDQDAQITVRSGGILIVTAPLDGITVTAGTGDILRVTHDGTTTTIHYDIVVMGTL